ncbi:transposase [Streptomyces sp. ST2-7A]|uniref:IS701 family transposase n=1 Tax=Streptomyces sp. ST2-7A TaxID=2907214 RepID=UPI001F3695CA|nr:transposase [Streptomyces sp. ST2-7A]MCE7079497.1 transposase [Streptomyces sp. ST2-7A]
MATGVTAAPDKSAFTYTDSLFSYLPRADQRRWAGAYLLGLLTVDGKKTVRNLAAAVTDSPTASQSLHQFINSSPWDWAPARKTLAARAERAMAPLAWTIDVALLRKRGPHSCGVHRRFISSTGRSAVCQLGVGVFLTNASIAVPVNWELLLPGRWESDPELRHRTRVPEDVHAPTVEQAVLRAIDIVGGGRTGGTLPIVADLSTCNEAERVVQHLSRRGLHYMVAVPDSFRVVLGRRPGRVASTGHGLAVSARSLFQFGAGDLFTVEPFPPTAAGNTSDTFMVGRVGVPGLSAERAPESHLLFAVRGRDTLQPKKIWLTSLAPSSPEERSVLLGTPWHAQTAMRRMLVDFGMSDFEGRSYPGWHHHMTMVSAAYAYDVLGAGGGLARHDRRLTGGRSLP